MSAVAARPRPLPTIETIDLYVPGRSKGTGGGKTYKLSANETPLGPSPAAVEAYKRGVDRLQDYPDGASTGLREAIAARFGLDPARIVCGCGSDDVLHLLAQAYVGPGDEAVISRHGFLVNRIAVLAAGGTPVVADERDLTVDVDALLAKVTPRTKAVFLANPNNPTGTYVPFEEIKRLHAGLPPHVLLVLDAAYAEYVRRNDYSSGLELVSQHDNVVMTRTFSKIYGLASLRLGWCYAPRPVCDSLNRIRGPFNTSGPGIDAGVEAIRDTAHVDRAVAHNTRWLDWLTAEVQALGLRVTPSVGNFLLIGFPDAPGRTAAEADAFLLARGLVLRQVTAYGLPDHLRMTVGSEEANRLAVEALRAFMAAAHG